MPGVRKPRWLALAAFLFVLAGCGADRPTAPLANSPLRIRSLRAAVVRLGTLGSAPGARLLYGLRLRANVCTRSHTEAGQLYPTTFRIAHYEPRTRTQADWGRPFRVVANDQYWLVPFGEAHGVCGEIVADDMIPPDNYGGVESPLGNPLHCWGVRLWIDASMDSGDGTSGTPVSATARTIVQCGSFHPS